MPEISVIVPVYNVEKYLSHCIESILNQSFKDFELILIDDGSQDGCPRICDQYAKSDSRIKVIHKENGGLSDARNFGLDIASGEYITFIDSDDYVSNDMFDILHCSIRKNNCDIVIANCVKVYDQDYVFKNQGACNCRVMTRNEAIMELCKGELKYVIVCAKLYKRKLWKEIRFPKGKRNEDTFVQHQLFYNCKKIAVINSVLYGYYVRQGSIMNENKSLYYFDCLEAYMERVQFIHNKKIDKSAIFNTIKLYWWWYFNLIPQIYNEELENKFKSVNKYKSTFIYYLLQDNSRSIKERIALTILLINPKLYNKLVIRREN